MEKTNGEKPVQPASGQWEDAGKQTGSGKTEKEINGEGQGLSAKQPEPMCFMDERCFRSIFRTTYGKKLCEELIRVYVQTKVDIINWKVLEDESGTPARNTLVEIWCEDASGGRYTILIENDGSAARTMFNKSESFSGAVIITAVKNDPKPSPWPEVTFVLFMKEDVLSDGESRYIMEPVEMTTRKVISQIPGFGRPLQIQLINLSSDDPLEAVSLGRDLFESDPGKITSPVLADVMKQFTQKA